MEILILNYSMNPDSLVFAHQRKIVEELTPSFDRATVVTADASIGSEIPNVTTISTQWQNGRPIVNSYKFIKIVIPILIKKRKSLIVFTHMAEVFAFLIAPICWLLRIPNHLWYAHTSRSPFLFCSYPFLTSVVTSTPGSCPIRGRKVKAIGQSIDMRQFALEDFPPHFPPLRWYHVGRLDPSKNVEDIIEAIHLMRLQGFNMTLDVFGGPSSTQSENYARNLELLASRSNYEGWLRFHGPVRRAQVVEIARDHDGFIHAFSGSLDKALLEAIASRRFVVSSNQEFHCTFNQSNKDISRPSHDLHQQIIDCIYRGESYMRAEIENRFNIVNTCHSLENWLVQLKQVLLKVK